MDALIGKFNTLEVIKEVEFGIYLDGGNLGEILLPTRFVPKDIQVGDSLEVFVYHDNESRLIATTMTPHACVGEVGFLEVVNNTKAGAFVQWGIMKDILVPLSQQITQLYVGDSYFIYLYIDEMTGRVAGTQKLKRFLQNEVLTVQEKEEVTILWYRKTNIGYEVIVNNQHFGMIHFSDVVGNPVIGEKAKGFVKTIRPDNKLDIGIGIMGYKKVSAEEQNILDALKAAGGYLTFHDKSTPEEIYDAFGISKKTFKMIIGSLYKQQKINLTQTGIQLIID
jgi:predicted RNA-binding protein (virulence factor B family)